MKVLLILGFLLFAVLKFECISAKKHYQGTKKPCTKHKHQRPLNVITRGTLHPTDRPVTEHITKYRRPSRKVKTPCNRHTRRPTKTTTTTIIPIPHTTRKTRPINHRTDKPPTTRPLTTACKESDCVVSEWSKWTRCSLPCGNTGMKQRSRKIIAEATSGGVCRYPMHEARPCNRMCPNGGTPIDDHCRCKAGYAGICCQKVIVNGNWSPWGQWSQCSQSCGSGKERRMRRCDNPTPANGGIDCQGTNNETRECNEKECPVNGGWSNWGPWSPCSSTCGQGQKFRLRQCSNPFPRNGGRPCLGLMLLTSQCQLQVCKIPDGGWSKWSEWSSCSKTCGKGTHVRTRACDSPLPSDGGRRCPGSSKEEKECINRVCIGSNGGSGGIGKRHVTIRRLLNYINSDVIKDFDNIVQSHNEMLSNREENTSVMGPWMSWSSCTVTCGTGQRFRSRACQDLANPCVGVPMEVQTCKTEECSP